MVRQAHSLDVLMVEVNAHAPNRSTDSDGGKASPEHTAANPDSDHEALDGVAWTARDITDDPTGGLDGSDLFHRILNLMRKGHPALKSGAYLIHNQKIVSYDRLSEGLRDYNGYNAHRQHVHVSVSDDRTGYDSLRPWNLWDDAPAKPTAPAARIPTIADCLSALKRLAAKSQNPRAAKYYTVAIRALGAILSSDDREKTPTSVAEIADALAVHRETVKGIRSKTFLSIALTALKPIK